VAAVALAGSGTFLVLPRARLWPEGRPGWPSPGELGLCGAGRGSESVSRSHAASTVSLNLKTLEFLKPIVWEEDRLFLHTVCKASLTQSKSITRKCWYA